MWCVMVLGLDWLIHGLAALQLTSLTSEPVQAAAKAEQSWSAKCILDHETEYLAPSQQYSAKCSSWDRADMTRTTDI